MNTVKRSAAAWAVLLLCVLVACGAKETPTLTGTETLRASPAATAASLSTRTPAVPTLAATLPAAAESQPTPETPAAESAATEQAPSEEPAAEPTEAPTPEKAAATSTSYAVQPGDSLLKLAMENEVPIAAIQLASDLGEQLSLQAGQVLTIPAESRWDEASPYWIVYQVEAGDTLSSIAIEHDLEIADLQNTNQLSDEAILAIDQQLVLPLDDPGAIVRNEPTPIPAAPAAPPAAVAESEAGTSDSAVAAPPPAAPVAPAAVPSSQLAADLFNQINTTRAAYGLYPLTYNGQLAQAAELHAQDCRQRGWCSHTGSDGSSSQTRILRSGYPAAGTAECWLWNMSPWLAIDIWMDEVPPNDAHRRTLLSTYLTEVGIGVAESGSGSYIVADFGRP